VGFANTLTSDVSYVMSLVQAGMDGIGSARRLTPRPPVGIAPLWRPAAVGAMIGASAVSLKKDRNPGYGAALGGLMGGVLGISCAVAWTSRGFTAALARGAARRIGRVRDARWLEKNPIDYA
jgi:hypothetical protein